MKSLHHLSQEFLSSLGVVDWGYSEEPVPMSYENYRSWIERDHQGTLQYLADERMKLRQDLRLIYPSFKSAFVFLFSYQDTKKWMLENQHHDVAAYSLGFGGEDYHYVLRSRLEMIFNKLQEEFPLLEKFVAIDAQPVLDRDLAYRAGLGWFGKNSMLIHQKEGSYFIIGSLLLNQSFEIPQAQLDVDHCGNCIACIEACPTQAIEPESRTIIANKCLATFTIEVFKEVQAPLGFEKSRGEIFGCDICQDVCPWNRKPLLKTIGQLQLVEKFQFLKNWFYEWSKEDLLRYIGELSNRGLKRELQGTPFDRPGRIGWLKNLKALLTISKKNNF